jgi:ubiquinone/menaquinone biosynthesis C-methylase UbiE
MSDLMQQFKRPTGREGRLVAAAMNRSHEALTTWGLSHVNIEAGWAILDVGCGGGRTVGRLAEKAVKGKVFGIDHSTDMVKYSIQKNKKLISQNRVKIIEGSVQNLPFPDDFFDLVTAIETYYFWDDLPAALQEIRRVLKPNGILLCVNEMVKDGVYEVKHKQIIEQTGVRLIPLEEIKRLLDLAGFCEVHVITTADSAWNLFLAKKPTKPLNH